MAIIKIPKSKIFNYNYNVLRDNYINKVYIVEEDAYNFIPIEFSITYTTVNGGVVNILPSPSKLEKTTFIDQETISNENYNYKVNYGYLQLPLESEGYYNYETFIGSIKKIMVNDLKVEFSSSDDYRSQTIIVPKEKVAAIMVFNKNIDSDGKLYFKIAYLWEDTTGFLPFVIYLKPSYVENNYVYQLSNESNDKYSLNTNTFYDKLNVEETTKDTLFEYVAKNIVERYNYGLMGLEIETRVSDFYDTDGNKINEGKPYLIKVGDIVKPEFPTRLSKFENTFIVTSSKYEYSGSEVVELKLLEYPIVERISWHSFYNTSKLTLNMAGESYYRVIISQKPATLETKKIRISGTLSLGGQVIELSNLETSVTIEKNFSATILTSGSNYLEVFITYSGSNKYYMFTSNTSASITNFVLEEGY